MAAIPKPSCKACRVAKAVNQKIKLNSKLYAFFAIVLIELLSIQLQEIVSVKSYLEFYYPLITQMALCVIFIAVNYHSERLRFCKRQKLIVIFLAVYYFLNIIFLLFPICWSDYYAVVNYSVLSIVGLLFLATWRNI